MELVVLYLFVILVLLIMIYLCLCICIKFQGSSVIIFYCLIKTPGALDRVNTSLYCTLVFLIPYF